MIQPAPSPPPPFAPFYQILRTLSLRFAFQRKDDGAESCDKKISDRFTRYRIIHFLGLGERLRQALVLEDQRPADVETVFLFPK